MKAAQLTAKDPTLRVAEVPTPVANDDEVLIEVHAAGVTPTELSWYPTTHNPDGTPRSNAIPGHEFSGIVARIGSRVKGFAPGDEVFGMNDWFANGATAQYCLTLPASIAKKPVRLTHAEAAAVPIGALTAWQGLVERAHLESGERVLIHGAAGAVGVFAVQLAHRRGAEVIATASGCHLSFVKSLGANQVIDYKTEAFDRVVRDVDVVFDAVGGDTLSRSWAVLKPQGRLVTIAASGNDAAADPRVKAAFFIVEPNQRQLADIAELFDAGQLRVFIDAQVSFAYAPAAYANKVAREQGLGKVVLIIAAQAAQTA